MKANITIKGSKQESRFEGLEVGEMFLCHSRVIDALYVKVADGITILNAFNLTTCKLVSFAVSEIITNQKEVNIEVITK